MRASPESSRRILFSRPRRDLRLRMTRWRLRLATPSRTSGEHRASLTPAVRGIRASRSRLLISPAVTKAWIATLRLASTWLSPIVYSHIECLLTVPLTIFAPSTSCAVRLVDAAIAMARARLSSCEYSPGCARVRHHRAGCSPDRADAPVPRDCGIGARLALFRLVARPGTPGLPASCSSAVHAGCWSTGHTIAIAVHAGGSSVSSGNSTIFQHLPHTEAIRHRISGSRRASAYSRRYGSASCSPLHGRSLQTALDNFDMNTTPMS